VKRSIYLPACFLSLILFPSLAWSQINACDLAAPYGNIDAADVQAAINMAIGALTCTANISGTGVCNIAVVQRDINAALGGACVTGYGAVPHSVTLNWVASTSSNIAGYNVYRAMTSGGPYTKTNTSLITTTSYVDTSAQAGIIYYYVVTAVDTSNNESINSNEAQATVPIP